MSKLSLSFKTRNYAKHESGIIVEQKEKMTHHGFVMYCALQTLGTNITEDVSSS